MTAQKAFLEQWYIELFENTSSTLQLPLFDIQTKYSDRPLYIVDYIDEDFHEKSVEIRFDKEKVTITYVFDKSDECTSAFLFSDDEQIIDDFVSHLTDNYDYCFTRSRFILNNCFLKVKEFRDILYLKFYQSK